MRLGAQGVAAVSCLVYKKSLYDVQEWGVTVLDAPVQEGGLQASLAAAVGAYARANPESGRRYQAATAAMPGGNTRSVLYYSPFPLCIVRGEGCALWDADGHRYTDMLAEFTAGIYGHSDPVIRAAIDGALRDGINLSGHNHIEAELARVVCERFPSIDLLRFANSGTEANLMAVAAAKAFTGRSKIMVFEGGYHGGFLAFPPGGSRVNVPHDFVVAPYNDMDAARRLIADAAKDLAAVLVEPMLGAGGCIPGDPAFLALLREETERCGAVLIFDEVMTSRLSAGGRQALLAITPDMTTLGKYIGGGLAFGAFGGRADIMAQFDPRRADALFHAGTFNNNTLTMAAGLAGLTKVLTPACSLDLNARGDRLRESLNALFARRDAKLAVSGLGSVMNLHPAHRAPATVKDLVFFDLIARGFYIARRGLIALSLPVSDVDVDVLVAAFDDILSARPELVH
jgi:glutamate-1-semialdehyde 2,1-aminomutase